VIHFEHPGNRGIVAYLRDPTRLARSVSVAKDRAECLPSDVEDPYLTLGTHPDLIERLWETLGCALPVDCRVIAYGVPALARPDSGVILGIAGGTMMYALRLDPAGAAAARAMGAQLQFRYPAQPKLGIEERVIDASTFGDSWVFGRFHHLESEWLMAGFAAAN
jgi:hypothetical protein